MNTECYSLRQMVDMTGVTEFTLRGWELRYRTFEPDRTRTGRRQYTAQDLQKALLLRELVKRHHRISSIASKSLSDLRKMMVSESNQTAPSADKYRSEIQDLMKSLALQDWDRLEDVLNQTVRRANPLVVIRELILPIFDQMSVEVSRGRLSVSQEHILSAMLKQCLNRLSASARPRSDVKIVIAGPEGDFHELGIFAANAMAAQFGLRTLFVGPNTPKKDLCETASRFGATHIILGSTVTKKEGAKEDFYKFIHFLDKNLPKHMAIWLGGRASQPVSLGRDAVQLTSLLDLEERLSKLSQSRGGK